MKAPPLAALIATLLVSVGALAQEHILTLLPDPEVVRVSPGGESAFRVAIENHSSHEADDVDVTFASPEGFSIEPSHATRARVRAFGKAALVFSVRVSSLAPGTYTVPLEATYTYCIGPKTSGDCYQIVEQLALPVSLEEGATSATSSRTGWGSPWAIVVPTLGLALLAGAVLLRRFAGLSFPLYGALVLVIAGALTYGTALRQPKQAQSIAAVLCTSCVGIEEARREAPTLSAVALAGLSGLNETIELLVFYAPWCQSCPYAEAMVKEMAAAAERVLYRFVNVDDERELARSYGVVTSARTVVPAIVRTDTGEVIFGAQDLEARLLRLLGVSA